VAKRSWQRSIAKAGESWHGGSIARVMAWRNIMAALIVVSAKIVKEIAVAANENNQRRK